MTEILAATRKQKSSSYSSPFSDSYHNNAVQRFLNANPDHRPQRPLSSTDTTAESKIGPVVSQSSAGLTGSIHKHCACIEQQIPPRSHISGSDTGSLCVQNGTKDIRTTADESLVCRSEKTYGGLQIRDHNIRTTRGIIKFKCLSETDLRCLQRTRDKGMTIDPYRSAEHTLLGVKRSSLVAAKVSSTFGASVLPPV